MSEPFVWPVTVYIEDTDAGGIVYYVNYLKFMERARTEMLRAKGFGKTAILGDGLMFVVHSAQIKYLIPAKLDEVLDVTASLQKAGRSYLVFAQQVRRQGSVLCEATVKVACVTQDTVRPHRIPQPVLEAFN